jgi:hypothetical protein
MVVKLASLNLVNAWRGKRDVRLGAIFSLREAMLFILFVVALLGLARTKVGGGL